MVDDGLRKLIATCCGPARCVGRVALVEATLVTVIAVLVLVWSPVPRLRGTGVASS